MTNVQTSRAPRASGETDLRLRRLEGRRPRYLPDFPIANLPAAADWRYALICAADATAGPVVLLSDGSHWLNVTDGSTVA